MMVVYLKKKRHWAKSKKEKWQTKVEFVLCLKVELSRKIKNEMKLLSFKKKKEQHLNGCDK